MGTSEKVLMVDLAIVVFFNVVFYISGYNSTLISASTILTGFVSAGIVAVLISLIPTTSGSGAITYIASGAIMLSILYAFNYTFEFFTIKYPVQIGAGLITNLTAMFSSNPSSFGYLAYIFFNMLGLIGVIAGMIVIAGSSG